MQYQARLGTFCDFQFLAPLTPQGLGRPGRGARGIRMKTPADVEPDLNQRICGHVRPQAPHGLATGRPCTIHRPLGAQLGPLHRGALHPTARCGTRSARMPFTPRSVFPWGPVGAPEVGEAKIFELLEFLAKLRFKYPQVPSPMLTFNGWGRRSRAREY